MPVVATNTAANSTIRFLNNNTSNQTTSLSKIASGSRIAKPSDDAAGQAISTGFSTDVMVLEQAATNAAEAVAILQTADSAAATVSDILMRMRALATQAGSATMSDTERAYINAEFTNLASEITAVATSARYLDKPLVCNISTFGTVMVGADASDTLMLDPASFDLCANGLGVDTSTLTTQSAATSALGTLASAINTVLTARASLGAQQAQFEFQASTIATSVEGMKAANSTIEDVDLAAEHARLTSVVVKLNAAAAATASANQMPKALLKLLQ